MNNRFNFVGEVVLPKKDSKRPFVGEKIFKRTDGTSYTSTTMSFGVKESSTNMAFVEGFDAPVKTIKTFDSDGNKIEIDWDDRNDPDIISTVANYKKYVVNLGDSYDSRREFLTQYDMMLFLEEELPKYKGKVAVSGQYTKSASGDKYYDHFKVQNVYAVPEDKKNRLGLTLDIFYNKDCIDKTDFKNDKKIYLDGYINQYVSSTEGSKYFPIQVVFNSSKYDLDNPKHKQLFDYKIQYIDVKNKNMGHLAWEVVLVRGVEEVEFSMDMLTPRQKQQVELGIKELDDFKPRGSIVGDKINEFRLFDPVLQNMGKDNDFSDGMIELDIKFSEFEGDIYIPNAKTVKLDDVIQEEKKNESKSDEDDDTLDLF